MANRARYNRTLTNVPGLQVLYAQILPNGTGVPTIGENKGKIIASVSRTGTGVIVPVLSDSVLSAGCFTQLQLAVAADSQVQVTSFVQSTKTLTLTILTAGSAADIAANAGNIIHLWIVARDSSAQ